MLRIYVDRYGPASNRNVDTLSHDSTRVRIYPDRTDGDRTIEIEVNAAGHVWGKQARAPWLATTVRDGGLTMDPNTALERIRALLAGDDWDNLTLAEVSESFEALDQWLSRGGFLPDAWHRGPVCPYNNTDECHMARERSVAGISDVIPPCPVHGS